jgi:hypothetical protein
MAPMLGGATDRKVGIATTGQSGDGEDFAV